MEAMAAKRTRDVLIDEDLKFDALLLKKSVIDGLRRAGFKGPSPVQLKAIPYGKCGLGKERVRFVRPLHQSARLEKHLYRSHPHKTKSTHEKSKARKFSLI